MKKNLFKNLAPLTSHPQIYQEIIRNLNSSYYQEEKQSKIKTIKCLFQSQQACHLVLSETSVLKCQLHSHSIVQRKKNNTGFQTV